MLSLRVLSEGLVLFGIFISDVDSEIECSLSKLANDTKLNGTTEGWNAIERHLDGLEK